MAGHVFPSLRYRDASAAIDFLEAAFGFERNALIENEDGTIAHAELRFGEAMVMLGSETADAVGRWGEHAGQGWIYVTVEDPDAHCARARDAGAEIVMELSDMDYGSRDYAARDPEGNLWNFGTYDPLDG
jgi:uncharacterized glyoxalase superfamily protein PhnB